MAERLPAVRPREVIQGLERGGFSVERQTGSHLTLRHPQTGRKVTVPVHNRDLKRATLASIIQQSGLSREEFLELL